MSLVLDNLNPEAQHQLEDVAAELGIAPGDIARRMIETAFAPEETQQYFFDLILLLLFMRANSEMASESYWKTVFHAGDNWHEKLRDELRNYVFHGISHHATWKQPLEHWRKNFKSTPDTTSKPPSLSPRSKVLIATLEQWNAEDATEDPQEIVRREDDWSAFEQNLHENRVSLPIPEV